MKNKWRILKILATVIIFGLLLSFSLKRFNNASMEKVSVNMVYPANKEKVYFIDEKNVRNFIIKSNPTGRIGDIDIPAMEKEMSNFPSVDSANVYLNLNGHLNVDIVQRVPAFRLNRDGLDFYVDDKGNEFPISKTYSHPSMLVQGDVKRGEYVKLAELVGKIDKDDFSRKYFIGISKEKGGYNLLTSDGHYKVEIGTLDNIELKVKGFKTFVEKFLVYQQPEKYSRVSVKYDNQIVTTLNPYFEENDSIITAAGRELEKIPALAEKKAAAVLNAATKKPETKPTEKPKIRRKVTADAKSNLTPTRKKVEAKVPEKPKTAAVIKPKATAKPAATKPKTETAPKRKATVKIE